MNLVFYIMSVIVGLLLMLFGAHIKDNDMFYTGCFLYIFGQNFLTQHELSKIKELLTKNGR